jgi:hypothetical protein
VPQSNNKPPNTRTGAATGTGTSGTLAFPNEGGAGAQSEDDDDSSSSSDGEDSEIAAYGVSLIHVHMFWQLMSDLLKHTV